MMGLINQVYDNNSFLERTGDFFAAPGRLFFGTAYRLAEQPDGSGLLKHPETSFSLSRTALKAASAVLLPFSLLSTLFGLTLKSIACCTHPGMREKYFLPVLQNARTEENFSGKLPKNPWTPNCVNSQRKSFWGKLYNADPIAVPAGMEDPVAAMKDLLSRLQATNYSSDRATLIEERGPYLHYTYTVTIPSGPLQGTYIDDLDLFFDEENRCFHIRSASRKGFRDAVHLDFSQSGVNKKRIEAIRQAFSLLP